jgi:hypothetical protein
MTNHNLSKNVYLEKDPFVVQQIVMSQTTSLYTANSYDYYTRSFFNRFFTKNSLSYNAVFYMPHVFDISSITVRIFLRTIIWKHQ